MAELTGNPGFAPRKPEQTLTRRHMVSIELVATLALTVSLVVAATAVSMAQKSMARASVIERTGAPMTVLRD